LYDTVWYSIEEGFIRGVDLELKAEHQNAARACTCLIEQGFVRSVDLEP